MSIVAVNHVMTVCGPIDPSKLGPTLAHEHILCDLSTAFEIPSDPSLAAEALQPVGLANASRVRQNALFFRDNLVFDDPQGVAADIDDFMTAGGRTIVELTCRGLSPNPEDLRQISQKTGVNIIAGTGYYTSITRPAGFNQRSIDSIASELVSDVVSGFASTGIQAGIIGELGIEGPGPKWGVRSITEIGLGDENL